MAGLTASVAMGQDPFLVDTTTLRTSPLGRVEVRAPQDGAGRMKLLGVAVEKCSVCLSQFKEGEVGCLGTHCQHPYVSGPLN